MTHRELAGRAAIITGASRGIGRAVAWALADAGFDVTVHYHSDAKAAAETAAGVRDRGREARVVAFDAADPAAVRAASAERTVVLGGWRSSISWRNCWNRSRSSARSIESGDVPMIGTPSFSSALASFNGVCPPNCTITPFGRSIATISNTSSRVSGSK